MFYFDILKIKVSTIKKWLSKGTKVFKIISKTEDINLEMWDNLKIQIKEFCIDYSKSKNKKSFDEIKKLVKQYKHCIDISEKLYIKDKLNKLQYKLYKGAYIRSKIHF